MLDQLRKRMKRIGTAAHAQEQREAMIDLVIWTMYADNLIALSENERIDQIAEEIAWDSPTPPEQYLNEAIARIRDVHSNPASTSEFLDDVFTRLASQNMRAEAYEACREIANVDGQIAVLETRRLNLIKERFDIADAS